MTSSADGLNSADASPGPDIEECSFSGIILDDCISIHGSLQAVKSSSGRTITVAKGNTKLQVGQPVRIGAGPFLEEAVVQGVALGQDGEQVITLDRALNVPAGAFVGNPLTNGAGYRILNCSIGGTRARGILVKGDHGLISSNLVKGCGMSGLSIGPEYSWKEGDYVRDVVVKNNRFIENGFARAGAAAVFVHGEGAMGNRDITIEDNQFDSNFGGDIDLQWTNGASLVNNHFSSPSRMPAGFMRSKSVTITNSERVRY